MTAITPAPKRRFWDWRYVRNERRRPYRMAFILFWGILMYFVSTAYVVSIEHVLDDSMYPTASKGYYLANRYVYHFSDPGRGDIVVLHRGDYGSEEEIKRVIGLPGETVQIKSGAVYIDGHKLNEPYAAGPTYPDYGPRTIAEGAYFVLADNRRVGEDSREYGPIRFTMIEGKIRPDVLFPFK